MAQSNGSAPAFPALDSIKLTESDEGACGSMTSVGGLTKREWLTGMAMQGLISDGGSTDPRDLAILAHSYAKAVLSELEGC